MGESPLRPFSTPVLRIALLPRQRDLSRASEEGGGLTASPTTGVMPRGPDQTARQKETGNATTTNPLTNLPAGSSLRRSRRGLEIRDLYHAAFLQHPFLLQPAAHEFSAGNMVHHYRPRNKRRLFQFHPHRTSALLAPIPDRCPDQIITTATRASER